jgi:very-short-patch-repair endonuclease
MSKTFSAYKDTPVHVTRLSRLNRLHQTSQEEKLWSMISAKRFHGLKFRRQFPIGRYIVDFYNHSNRLVIEIDGGIHSTTLEYDRNREAFLSARGYNILRFTNADVDSDIQSVLKRILESSQVPLRGI